MEATFPLRGRHWGRATRGDPWVKNWSTMIFSISDRGAPRMCWAGTKATAPDPAIRCNPSPQCTATAGRNYSIALMSMVRLTKEFPGVSGGGSVPGRAQAFVTDFLTPWCNLCLPLAIHPGHTANIWTVAPHRPIFHDTDRTWAADTGLERPNYSMPKPHARNVGAA